MCSYFNFITSAKEVLFYPAFVFFCLFVYLFVHIKTAAQIFTKIFTKDISLDKEVIYISIRIRIVY